MAKSSQKVIRRIRVRRSIRQKISGTPQRPRLAVFRSNKEIYAQLIDDVNGVTLATASSKTLDSGNKSKSELSKEVGTLIAEKAKAANVEVVVFDRAGYLYHGRVKALGDAAREAGLVF